MRIKYDLNQVLRLLRVATVNLSSADNQWLFFLFANPLKPSMCTQSCGNNLSRYYQWICQIKRKIYEGGKKGSWSMRNNSMMLIG